LLMTHDDGMHKAKLQPKHVVAIKLDRLRLLELGMPYIDVLDRSRYYYPSKKQKILQWLEPSSTWFCHIIWSIQTKNFYNPKYSNLNDSTSVIGDLGHEFMTTKELLH
jgi:hypothetical protein